MSRPNHDVHQGHYMLAWAKTDQARLRRVFAQEHMAQQMAESRLAGPLPRLAARLRQVGAALWMAASRQTARAASATSRDVPAGAAYDCSSGPRTEMPRAI